MVSRSRLLVLLLKKERRANKQDANKNNDYHNQLGFKSFRLLATTTVSILVKLDASFALQLPSLHLGQVRVSEPYESCIHLTGILSALSPPRLV